eukprot:scaffold14472_cov115-Isochrysis_galbana.AAC.2
MSACLWESVWPTVEFFLGIGYAAGVVTQLFHCRAWEKQKKYFVLDPPEYLLHVKSKKRSGGQAEQLNSPPAKAQTDPASSVGLMQKDTDGEVTALDISNRGLAELPAFLCDGSLPRLRRLKVSGNALTELSPALLAGGSLSELIAGANQVWLLPDELGLCSKLEILGLGSNRLPALPASIGRCAALRTLRLSDNLLTELPGEIGSCTSLTDLFLAGNQLMSLPVALSRCPLVSLNVSANALTELPEGLCAGVGSSLKTLQLSDNRLASLPADVGELRLLETLNLNGNRLRELPSSFGRLGAVVTVGLGANRLTALPHNIGGLRSLRTIQLGENRLATLPESIGACSGLEDLGLAQNLLQCLPRSVSSLTRLRSLVLAQAKCAALPCEVGKLTALLQLELSGSKLEALPAEICELAALLSLRASDCRLVTLPEQLGSLSALQTLRVDGNRLARLPPTVGRLQWLKELWAGGNALASLPPSVGLLSQLRVLGLSSNQIETLPTQLCACARLERLLVDDNRLHRLPDELEQLEACRELGLSANQLSEPPATLPPRLESLRLNSNLIGRLPVWPRTPAELWLHDNPCWGGRVAPANALPAGRDAGEGRPLVAVLLPGLVRSYAHGEHWRSLFSRYADAYELRAFMHVWPICGSVANNFNQEADRAAGHILDLDKLRAAYPVREGRSGVAESGGFEGALRRFAVASHRLHPIGSPPIAPDVPMSSGWLRD